MQAALAELNALNQEVQILQEAEAAGLGFKPAALAEWTSTLRGTECQNTNQ